jgi:hypothetical protein
MVPVLAAVFRRRKHSVGKSWRMDETYIKVAGEWKYLYRAMDVVDMVEPHRAATPSSPKPLSCLPAKPNRPTCSAALMLYATISASKSVEIFRVSTPFTLHSPHAR